jgi:suppressor for copper-sensitivity B
LAAKGLLSRKPDERRALSAWLAAALLALTASLTPAHALAAAGPWAKADLVEARLVSAVEGVGDLRTVPVGVELRIPPGWKTYWRSPGDAGLPPTLDWAGSANLESASLSFPAPQRFQLFGLQTFGYGDHVLFPVAAAVAEPGRPLELAARLDALVCAEVCVPQAVDLTLGLPAGPGGAGRRGPADRPLPGAGARRRRGAGPCDRGREGGGARRPARAGGDSEARASLSPQPDVVAELDPHLGLGPPDVRLTEGGRRRRPDADAGPATFRPARAGRPAGDPHADRRRPFGRARDGDRRGRPGGRRRPGHRPPRRSRAWSASRCWAA